MSLRESLTFKFLTLSVQLARSSAAGGIWPSAGSDGRGDAVGGGGRLSEGVAVSAGDVASGVSPGEGSAGLEAAADEVGRSGAEATAGLRGGGESAPSPFLIASRKTS